MMRAITMIRSALVLGLAALAGVGGSSLVAQNRDLSACPSKMTSGSALTCSCAARDSAYGPVWGTDVYTDDSSVCHAAVHAGIIGFDGGVVTVVALPGRASYAASERNGVASSPWAGWGRSITFRAANIAGGARPLPPRQSAAASCPSDAQRIGDVGLTCRCGGGSLGAGPVWGSGPYTADSSICNAAVHSGLIGDDGGVVTLRIAPGRASYAGTQRNGVSTGNWGTFEKSFVFVR